MSPGRPPKPPEERRTEWVGVRLTRQELVRLYYIARVSRKDVSVFIRDMALGNFGSESMPKSLDSPYND